MQRRSALASAIAVVATIIGAGFASGREIIVFFARFGRFAWLGAIAAGLALGGISYGIMSLYERWHTDRLPQLCACVLGKVGGRIASWLCGLLIATTAGAMASGLGEIAALMLPIRYAQALGLIIGVVLCAMAAWRGVGSLATGGGVLIAICLILYVIISRLPASAMMLEATPRLQPFWFLPYALCYASMNGAMCCGVLGELAPGMSIRVRRQACLLVAVIIAGLLCAAVTTLMPHMQRLQDAALPMVVLAHEAGAFSVALCIGMLLLAMGTTLIAMLRAMACYLPERILPQRRLGLAAGLSLILGSIGFNWLIGVVYPILGWCSAAVLIALLVFGARHKRGRS